MENQTKIKVALIGNPNCGKTSLFNHLTGLNQKIGNFPGVTVEKKMGQCPIFTEVTAEILDLPGIYGLYPRSADEQVVFDILNDKSSESYPDLVVTVLDANNLKRNLLLFSQVKDLGFPVVVALNMLNIAAKRGKYVNAAKLSEELGVPVIPINARTGENAEKLKHSICHTELSTKETIFDIADLAKDIVFEVKEKFQLENNYRAYQLIQQYENNSFISETDKKIIAELREKYQFNAEKLQSTETVERYKKLQLIYEAVVKKRKTEIKDSTKRIDKILTHKVWGYLILIGVLFSIFQAIFTWASLPMDFIDGSFSKLSVYLQEVLPSGVFSDLISQGLIPGLGGVLIFIPQIVLLFGFISLLDESGYMARVVFLMDKIMRPFGLNGKSIVPLISGTACAIPAIMATRNIEHWKERLITIFVTPFMSCSARLPIYAILISLVVPDREVLGFMNLQGLTLMALYALGFIVAIISAWIFKLIIKQRNTGYFVMELPNYSVPKGSNVGISIYENVKSFVLEAGKIIIAVSVVLWVLASFGPSKRMEQVEVRVQTMISTGEIEASDYEQVYAGLHLENSYAGIFGKAIEPAIRPLGFDWKIGIALITSFAAREIFVGSMATIYSVGNEAKEGTIKSRMRQEIDPETGEPRYTLALAFSLLIFYAFAMQCMSTLAIVKKETQSWKWPLIQLFYMTGLAYLGSLITYNLLS